LQKGKSLFYDRDDMPRKTLALISGLVLVTIVLFVVALRAGQQENIAIKPPPPPPPVTQQIIPTVPAHSVLTLGSTPLFVAPGKAGKVDVTIDTADNDVTAVQLEIGYDPNILSNVKVTSGSLFVNPAVLIDKNDVKAGRYTYAVGILPNAKTLKGTGVVATISFTTTFVGNGKQTQLGLLPTSLITARGIAKSVMKSATGTIITVGSATISPTVPIRVGAVKK
jgi:hypothetical protein